VLDAYRRELLLDNELGLGNPYMLTPTKSPADTRVFVSNPGRSFAVEQCVF